MSARTFGDVDRLEEFTDRTLRSLPDVQAAVHAYRRALAEVADAPSDLPIDLDDRSAETTDLVGMLALIDQLPAAFAFALRELDDRTLRLPGILSTHNHQGLEALAHARIEHPAGSTEQVRAAAAGREIPDAGGAGWLAGAGSSSDGSLADEVGWFNIAVTAADASRGSLAERRARRGTGADGARRWTKATPWLSGTAGVALTGVEQHLADAGEPNFTAGQRIVRTSSAVLFEGVPAWAGGVVGGVAGVGAGPAGPPAGAVAGAEAGAAIGRRVGRARPVATTKGWIARRLDRRLGSAHDDDYDAALDLKGPR